MKDRRVFSSFVAKQVHDSFWNGFITGLAVEVFVIAAVVLVIVWQGGYV